jgi:hypothetical protein
MYDVKNNFSVTGVLYVHTSYDIQHFSISRKAHGSTQPQIPPVSVSANGKMLEITTKTEELTTRQLPLVLCANEVSYLKAIYELRNDRSS